MTGLAVDPGYAEFQRLEEGLLYLGHLNGYRNRDRSVPWAPGASTAAEYILVDRDGSSRVQAPSADIGPGNLMDGFDLGDFDPRQAPDFTPRPRRQSIEEADLYEQPAKVKAKAKAKKGVKAGSGGGGRGGPPPTAPRQSAEASWDGALKHYAWYHGEIGREIVLELVEDNGLLNGSWLVRAYRQKVGWCVLSVCFESEVYHLLIQRNDAGSSTEYSIEGGPKFAGINALTQFYQSTPGSELPTMLQAPIEAFGGFGV